MANRSVFESKIGRLARTLITLGVVCTVMFFNLGWGLSMADPHQTNLSLVNTSFALMWVSLLLAAVGVSVSIWLAFRNR